MAARAAHGRRTTGRRDFKLRPYGGNFRLKTPFLPKKRPKPKTTGKIKI